MHPSTLLPFLPFFISLTSALPQANEYPGGHDFVKGKGGDAVGNGNGMPGSNEWGSQVAEWEKGHPYYKRAYGVQSGSAAAWDGHVKWDAIGVKTGMPVPTTVPDAQKAEWMKTHHHRERAAYNMSSDSSKFHKDSKRHHAPTSLLSNSEFENFDCKHGHYKRDKNDNMPSEGPERWTGYVNRRPNSPNPSPKTFDKNKGDHKRRDGVLSERAEHWTEHGSYGPSMLTPSLPEKLDGKHGNHKRHEMPSSMPSGMPTYWLNHGDYKPTVSIPSISSPINFDRRHGNHKSHEIPFGMPSGAPTYWSNHHSPTSVPSPSNFNWKHENHKRHHGIHSNMPSGTPAHGSNHGYHKPAASPTPSIPSPSNSPQNHKNHKRHESIPSGAASYWQNHDNHQPATPSDHAPENHHMSGSNYKRAEPDLILSYTPLARRGGENQCAAKGQRCDARRTCCGGFVCLDLTMGPGSCGVPKKVRRMKLLL